MNKEQTSGEFEKYIQDIEALSSGNIWDSIQENEEVSAFDLSKAIDIGKKGPLKDIAKYILDLRLLEEKSREFRDKFNTDEKCRLFLFERRWPNGYRCPKPGCNHRDFYYHRTRKLYQCKQCGHQASVTAGTIFEKTRTPLPDWFALIFFTTQRWKKLSTKKMQRSLTDRNKGYDRIFAIRKKIEDVLSDKRALKEFKGLVDGRDIVAKFVEINYKKYRKEEITFKKALDAVERDFREMGLIKKRRMVAKKLSKKQACKMR